MRIREKQKTQAYKDAEKSFMTSWKKATRKPAPDFDLLVKEFHKGVYEKGGSDFVKVYDIVNYTTTRWLVKDSEGECLLISYYHDIGVPFFVSKLVYSEEEFKQLTEEYDGHDYDD